MAAPVDRPPGRLVGGEPGYGWIIVAALGTSQTVSWGVLYYAFPVVLIPMSQELGHSTLSLTGAFSVALAISGVTGVGVGRWLDRRSPRILMTAGSAVAALLVIAWSQASSLLDVYLAFAGIGAVMATVLYEPAFIVVTQWFSVRRREALTAVTLVAALASFLFSPLSERLTAALGWRSALIVLAGILFLVTVPLHGLALRPPPTGPRGRLNGIQGPRRPVTSLPGFPGLTASFCLGAFTTSAMSIHIVALLLAAGHRGATAAMVAGLAGVSQIPGRIAFARVGRRLGDRRLAAAVFGAGSLAFSILALWQSSMAVIGFAVLFGGSAGMTTLLRPTLIGDLYGTNTYGRIAGVAGAWVMAVRAVAPLAAAALALLPGGYTTVSWVLAAASAIAASLSTRAVEAANAWRSPKPREPIS